MSLSVPPLNPPLPPLGLTDWMWGLYIFLSGEWGDIWLDKPWCIFHRHSPSFLHVSWDASSDDLSSETACHTWGTWSAVLCKRKKSVCFCSKAADVLNYREVGDSASGRVSLVPKSWFQCIWSRNNSITTTLTCKCCFLSKSSIIAPPVPLAKVKLLGPTPSLQPTIYLSQR